MIFFVFCFFSLRDALTVVTDNGYMFGGNGYVILAKDRFRPEKISMVRLSVKTFAENGLIYLMGLEKDFLSIEMRDGNIVYQYDLGSGRLTLRSNQKFNDGKWHTIQANRLSQDGILKIDSLTGRMTVNSNGTIFVVFENVQGYVYLYAFC